MSDQRVGTADGGVSIVIPVYNDPEGIQRTLDSLLTNTMSDASFVVVDNGSTDQTSEVVKKYAAGHPAVIHETETERQGSYAARNTGIRTTTREILAFVDAGVTVTESWLSTAVRILRQRDVHYLAPDVQVKTDDNPTFAARYDAFTAFPIQEYVRRLQFAPTACLFVTQELITDVGIFDPRLSSGGDREFGNRVHDSGYELHYTPEVVVNHPPRDSIAALVNKDFRVGRGIAQLQRYYPERYGKLGRPPCPSGVKSVESESDDGGISSLTDHFGFQTLRAMLMGVRATGYVYEVMTTMFATDSSGWLEHE